MSSQRLFRTLLDLPPSLRRGLWTSANPSSNPEIYDVVCIGGGPAGLSLVSTLLSNASTERLKIALIDSQDLTNIIPPHEAKSYSNRCSSLTPSSVRFLSHAGVWDHVNAARIQPYHSMDVWDGVSGSKIHFDSAESKKGLLDTIAELVPGNRFSQSKRQYEVEGGEGTVATMCENGNLTSALLQRLAEAEQQHARVELVDKARVESIHLGRDSDGEHGLNLSQWPVVQVQGRQLAARLLVGADGINSLVRNFADISSHGWDYNQHGVVATLHLDHCFQASELRAAYQRFLPTGPIALLPLPDNNASLVWSTTPQHAAKLKHLNHNDFVATVNAAFRLMPVDINYMLTHLATGQQNELSWREISTSAAETGLPSVFPRIIGVQDGTVASFPLRMRHAATYTGHRVALIGDAAHTIHPLAGQGLNLGLADAESLAKQVAYGTEHGMDIGSSWCLDDYTADRWAANNAMVGVIDKLQKLYSASTGPVVWGRSLGVGLVDRLGPVKGLLMSTASGMR